MPGHHPHLPSQGDAPADHVHARAQPLSVDTGALQDGAVTSAKIADGTIATGDLNASVYAVVGTISAIDPDDAASAGTSATVARGDHQHDATTAAPVSVGTANAEGSSGDLARADHVHGVNVPCVRAVWSANTSIPNDGVAAVAFGGTDEYDTDTMHNPAANNTRITFNTAGVYDVGGWYVMASDVDGSRGIYIQKNGTTIIAQSKITTACFGGAPNDAMEISTTAKFVAADYVELFAQNIAAGVALNVTNGAFYATYRTAG